MPAQALRCRVCEREHPLEAVGVCSACFGPLDPVYDKEALRRTLTREAIAAGPPSLWRYAPLLPVTPPAEPRLAPGCTPLLPAPRLASALGVGELYLKLDTANPTHSFKDRVVAVACQKALEVGAQTLACSSTGNLANAVAARAAAEGLEAVVLCPADLEPEKLAATAVYGATIYAVEGSYDDCSRLSIELSFELPWAFVNVNLRSYYAEGSKTVAFEIAEQLGWRLPDAVACPIASGALYSKVHQGFGELRELGLVDGPAPRLYGGQAEGCAPVAHAFAEERRVTPLRPATVARSLAIGNPADGDLAVATAQASGGAIYAVAEEEVGSNMALLAETTGVFGETAAGVTLGALREAVRRGEVGEEDTVVLLVTGDGLKTPQPIEERVRPLAVEPDADALLERLGVVL
ncbi:MAG: threonine synthase [Thermoleophilia bacterium]|nr:threonine synthase [Gaiellaceae bacterium]MDW8339520.1 threonine synthase [Thermoleophilia bacterium]